MDIGGAVREAVRRFKADVLNECCCADFCDQLLFAVCVRTKECCLVEAIQAACMTGAVRQLVKGCAVISGGTLKTLGFRVYTDYIIRNTYSSSTA